MFNVTVGSPGLALSVAFRSHPVLAIVFLATGTLCVIGSMPIFWPAPSTFLAGTAAAAGIGIVNSVGNLGGYVGPNIPVWMKGYSKDPPAGCFAGLIRPAGRDKKKAGRCQDRNNSDGPGESFPVKQLFGLFH